MENKLHSVQNKLRDICSKYAGNSSLRSPPPTSAFWKSIPRGAERTRIIHRGSGLDVYAAGEEVWLVRHFILVQGGSGS